MNKYNNSTLENVIKYRLSIIQSLPETIATAAVYMLLGALPTEAKIHKEQLSLLHVILNSGNRKVKEIVERLISVMFITKTVSFIES